MHFTKKQKQKQKHSRPKNVTNALKFWNDVIIEISPLLKAYDWEILYDLMKGSLCASHDAYYKIKIPIFVYILSTQKIKELFSNII